MNLKKLLLILALFFATTAASTDVEGPPLVPEFNREAKVLTIQVIIYPTHEDVTRAKVLAYPKDPPEALLGWAAWGPKPTDTCEIHVARADRYMDKEFAVWGHELAHCLYGNFHKELDTAH